MTGGVNHFIPGNLAGSVPGRAPLLADRAYAEVRDMIVTLRLPPGSAINEERLSAELGVGRTPLRDALKRLEAETLVAIYPRQGTFVTEVNITDHGLITDVRRQLEGHAAQRAAEREGGWEAGRGAREHATTWGWSTPAVASFPCHRARNSTRGGVTLSEAKGA